MFLSLCLKSIKTYLNTLGVHSPLLLMLIPLLTQQQQGLTSHKKPMNTGMGVYNGGLHNGGFAYPLNFVYDGGLHALFHQPLCAPHAKLLCTSHYLLPKNIAEDITLKA